MTAAGTTCFFIRTSGHADALLADLRRTAGNSAGTAVAAVCHNIRAIVVTGPAIVRAENGFCGVWGGDGSSRDARNNRGYEHGRGCFRQGRGGRHG